MPRRRSPSDRPLEPSLPPPAPETCAHCGLGVASWRTERDGKVFCSFFCDRAAHGLATIEGEKQAP